MSRRPPVSLATALAALVATVLLTTATPVQGATKAKKPTPVYVYNCAKSSIRPSEITLFCADAGVVATSISYSSYGGATATARATFEVDSCTPNCAAGKLYKLPGKLMLTGLVRCSDNRDYYSKASYTFTTRDTHGNHGQSTALLTPPKLKCRVV